MPLSLNTVNEVVGEIAPSGMLGLDRGPVLGDPLRGSIWFEAEDHVDVGQRDLQLTQSGDQLGVVELGLRVVTVPGVVIDPRRR